jgi:predicted hydrolase (HD superfamily)
MNHSLLLHRTTFGDPSHRGNVLSRIEATQLLEQWVKNDKLRLHMRQVGHLMQMWAQTREGLDAESQWQWYLAGLLHDADWDQWPQEHCRRIIGELETRQVDPAIIRAIACHGPRVFGVEPEAPMEKMLYAFDELSGLIHAYSLMRPGGYDGMEVGGVKKRLKDKTFAAQVSREDINDAAARVGISVEEVIAFIVKHQAALPDQ